MPIRVVGLPRSRARKRGVVEMRPPMTLAMTMLVAVHNPALRRSQRAEAGGGWVRTDMHSALYLNPGDAGPGSEVSFLICAFGPGRRKRGQPRGRSISQWRDGAVDNAINL